MPAVDRQFYLFCEEKDVWNLTTLPVNAIAKYMKILSAKIGNAAQVNAAQVMPPQLFRNFLTSAYFVDSKHDWEK